MNFRPARARLAVLVDCRLVPDAVWLEEAERRLAAYRAGKVRGVPGEDIFGTT